MDLLDASTFFDDDPVYDAYSGDFLFNAQVSSFNDSKSDGSTDRRRILSAGPNLLLPARGVIQMYGGYWLMGVAVPDGFYGEVSRQHFTTKRVTNLLNLLTPAQALAQGAGTTAYVHMLFFKDTVNQQTDSEYDSLWNVFLYHGEPASKGTFLRDEQGRLYRVRNDYLPLEGLRILQSDELDADAFQSCVFDTGALDPVTETLAGGTTTANCIRVEVPKFYRFRHVSDSFVQAGDMGLFVPSSVTLRQGMTFAMAGHKWRVMSFQPEIDAQAALVRRA